MHKNQSNVVEKIDCAFIFEYYTDRCDLLGKESVYPDHSNKLHKYL